MKLLKENDKLFNIPNCLCYFRILLIPVFLFVYFNAKSNLDYIIATLIVVISGGSDWLDGFIARKYNLITDFGKVLDPIADKLTQFVIAGTLIYTYPMMWGLLIIILIKDAMLALGSFYLFEHGYKARGASWWGKIATAYFYFVVIILIGGHIPETFLADILIVTSIILMLLSLVLYAKQLYEIYKSGE